MDKPSDKIKEFKNIMDDYIDSFLLQLEQLEKEVSREDDKSDNKNK